MDRIKANELSLKGIGKYIAYFDAHARVISQSENMVSYARIEEVIPENHLIVLSKITGEEKGEEFFSYYKNDSEVDVYNEDEVLVLIFKDFNSQGV